MNEARKTVLITGAAGALAQQVINRLHGRYNLVVCDARREVSMPEDIPSYRVDFNKRRFEDLFREYRFDSIIHLGRIGPNEHSREGRYAANVIGSQRLLDMARKYGVGQTLILSTYFVYGAHPLNPAYLCESSPLKAGGLTLDLVDSVELENLATGFAGVERAYAISAGRELRVLVKPEEMDDVLTYDLCRQITKRIEDSMEYPGTIKVTVIRETRETGVAK